MDPNQTLALLQERSREAEVNGSLHWESLKLSSLPQQIRLSERLVSIKLSNNDLVEFPSSLRSLKLLHTLELDANQLVKIPPAIGEFQSMKSLFLHNNCLVQIAPEIGQLGNLKVLLLQGNRLHEVPLELCSCTALTTLNLQDNVLREPFVAIADLEISDLFHALRNLLIAHERQELHLTLDYLKVLRTDAVHHAHRLCTVLTSLQISNVETFEIIEGIGDFKCLQSFFASNSGIHSISPSFGEMESLVFADLRDNKLTQLPDGFDRLRNIQTLLLDGNEITLFPPPLCCLTSLAFLSMSENVLVDVDGGIGNLVNLVILDLSYNKLVDLPVEMRNLLKLCYLNVEGNEINSCPLHLLDYCNMTAVKFSPVDCDTVRHEGPTFAEEYQQQLAHLLRKVKVGQESTGCLIRYFEGLYYGISSLSLDLSGIGLQNIPPPVFTLTHLTSLSLSNNRISSVPIEMIALSSLVNLDFSGNDTFPWLSPKSLSSSHQIVLKVLRCIRASIQSAQLELNNFQLRYVPSTVWSLEGLREVRICNNFLTTLPEDLGDKSALCLLETLDLSHNLLLKLPASIGNLTNLSVLRCTHNDLRHLPDELCNCSSLQTLSVDNNPLESPPMTVVTNGFQACMSYLADVNDGKTTGKLRLVSFSIRWLPPEVFQQADFTHIQLQKNQLLALPDHICNVKSLKVLNVSENNLSSLPDAIGLLACLAELYAEDNKLERLPPTFPKLPVLRICWLRRNELTWIANDAGNMNSLVDLQVGENPLRSPPPDIVEQGTFRILRYLRCLHDSERNRMLDLSALGLTSLPLIICRQTALIELKLFKNKLQSLPMKVGRLTGLTRLVLSSNLLRALPPNLAAFSKLKRLYAEDNLFTELHPSLFSLSALLELRLAGNNLDEIPKAVGRLRHLLLLDVSRNRLSNLPSSITELVELKKLRMGHNKFETLPLGIAALKQLEELNVGKNPLLNVLPEVALLPKLKLLLMDGNDQLFSPPPEIRAQGLPAISAFLMRMWEGKHSKVLDLGWMGMERIFINAQEYQSVTTLNLSGNRLEQVPPSIFVLTNLRTLNVDENRIQILAAGMARLSSLTKLSFKGNPVQSPPREVIDKGTDAILSYLHNLLAAEETNVLDLSRQDLQVLHSSIFLLYNLRQLIIDDNFCTSIPLEVCDLTRLELLSAKRNRLESLPVTLGRISTLSSLLLDHNPSLRSLPPQLSFLPSWTDFTFEGNELLSPGMEICSKGIAPVKEYLSALLDALTSKRLDLSSCGMQTFAIHHAANFSLTQLDISNNLVSELVPETFTFLNLVHINVSSNRLLHIPVLVGNLRELREFIADGNLLDSLPASFSYIETLTHLSLADNNISDIPSDFGNFKALHHLDLAGNQLEALAPEIGHVISLSRVNLARNKIVSIPFEWGLLSNLSELDLSGNPVRDPPPEIRRKGANFICMYLRRLRDSSSSNLLNLQGMNLTSVSDILGRNYNLLEVLLDNNRLTSLPSSVSSLRRLRILSVTNNQLKALPFELGWCTTLERLDFDKEAVVSPPIDVTEGRDVATILRYLRSLSTARSTAKLDLASLKHRRMPAGLLELTSLTFLSLKDNLIEEVDITSLLPLSLLTHLDVSGNKISSIPQELGQLTALECLHVDRNPLTSLPRSLCHLTNLRDLVVQCADLTSPPHEIHGEGPGVILKYLRCIEDGLKICKIDLEGCMLIEVPDELFFYTSLTSLSLAKNRIRTIPIRIGDLLLLKHLSFEDNQVVIITSVMWQMTKLKTLNLSRNRMRSVPPEFGLFSKSLRLLDLTHCELLSSPPPEIIAEGTGTILPYLRTLWSSKTSQTLTLSNWNLESYTCEVLDNFAEILVVEVSNNRLTSLPPSLFDGMKSLRKLLANNNRISRLPDNVSSLTTLQLFNLDDNQISSLPDSLCLLYDLQTLSLSHNELTSIPDQFGLLTGLVSCNLSSNKLQGLPASLSSLVSLQTLNVQENKIKSLPDNCSRLTSLRSLNVSENLVEHLTPDLGLIPYIDTVHAAHNPLVDPPEEVAVVSGSKLREYMQNMSRSHATKELFLHEMNLSHVPPPMTVLTFLTRLSLVGNQLQAIPPPLFHFSLLQLLDLSSNRIYEIPPSISEFRDLRVFRINKNNLHEIPLELCSLPSLQELCFVDNLIHILPTSIALMTSLQVLQAHGNDSRMPPQEIVPRGLTAVMNFLALLLAARGRLPEGYSFQGQKMSNRRGELELNDWSIVHLDLTLSDLLDSLEVLCCNRNLMQDLPEQAMELVNLSRLELNHNLFKQMPAAVFYLTSLRTLSMSNNQIAIIPQAIESLEQLRTLDMSFNKIAFLPKGMARLSSLQQLYLRDNQLSHLHDAIDDLTTLVELDISSNKLTSVPAGLTDFVFLAHLDLSWNFLDTLSMEFDKLSCLTRIDISNNRFDHLPDSIYCLTQLRLLRMKNNRLTSISPQVVAISTLEEIEFDGNKIADPPADIARMGFRHIMEYLDRRNEATSSRRLNLSKLGLETVPFTLVQLTNLTSLSLANNLLEVLDYQGTDEHLFTSKEFASLRAIGAPVQAYNFSFSSLLLVRELDISHNNITFIPVDFLLLTNLAALNLANNKLTVFYLEFAFITSLTSVVTANNLWRSPHEDVMKRPTAEIFEYMRRVFDAHHTGDLDLSSWQLSAVTNDIALGTRMQALKLDNNVIELLSPEISQLKVLQTLRMRHNKLRTLPWEIAQLEQLRHLDLGENRLMQLPAVVGTLTSVVSLLLDKNSLESLPNSIGDLTNLEKLCLEDNQLQLLPPTFPSLSSLTYLDLSLNKIKFLPNQINRMKSLQEAYFQRNEISILPSSISLCTGLHTLNLANNQVVEIPKPFHRLTNLTFLSLSNNKIKMLPPSLSRISLLVNFNFDDNPILDPPDLVVRQGLVAVFQYLKRMYDVKITGHIDLRDLELEDLPTDLLGIVGSDEAEEVKPVNGKKQSTAAPINELTLIGNKLKYLPTFVGTLSCLQRLHVDDGLIDPPKHIMDEGIPIIQMYLRRIGDARSSMHLDLSGMELSESNISFHHLNYLLSINLASNALTRISDEILTFTMLTMLDFRFNKIDDVPPSLSKLVHLRHIDLRSNNFSQLPSSLLSKESLRYLCVDNNQIGYVSLIADTPSSSARTSRSTSSFKGGKTIGIAGIQNLLMKNNSLQSLPELASATLTNMDLSHNRLEDEIFVKISSMTNLRILRMQHNCLSSIPEDVENLRSLMMLDCSFNQIAEISPQIGKILGLSSLMLRHNLIEHLPNEFFRLTNLQQLALSHNKIRSIPTLIGQLTGLREVSFENNQLMSIPLELGNLTSIEQLRLEDNPGNLLPEGFTAKGMDAVMEFFAWNCQYTD